jgi:hypothetical protein
MSLIEIDYRPSRRQLRVFGTGCVVLLGIVGALLRPGHTSEALALWSVGGLCGVAALMWPDGLRWVYVGVMLVTWPLGLVMSWVVLALVFYGVITPVGLVMRLLGRDALARRFDRSAATYWVTRRSVEDPERYFRQY